MSKPGVPLVRMLTRKDGFLPPVLESGDSPKLLSWKISLKDAGGLFRSSEINITLYVVAPTLLDFTVHDCFVMQHYAMF